jgi:hypothetical protein
MEVSKTYYLAGPMTGYPQFNYPLFDKVAALLREQGYAVISPAELDGDTMRKIALASPDGSLIAFEGASGHTWGDVLARDVKIVADTVEGIIFLPGWDKSRGARLEAMVGILCGHEFREYHSTTGKLIQRPAEWVKERIL